MPDKLISFYRPPITSNQVPESSPMTLRNVWEYIQGTRAKKRTEDLRKHLQEGNKAQYDQDKKRLLDFVTFGGVFSYRNTENLISPSGYLILDIDHVPLTGKDLLELETSLARDKELGVRLIFVSPSGDGLKIVVESLWGITDEAIYKREYFCLLGYIHEKYNLPFVIKNGKKIVKDSKTGEEKEVDNYEKILDDTTDITRTCFLCYDKESLLMEEGSPLYSIGFNSDEHYFLEEDIKREIRLERGETPTTPTRKTGGESYYSGDWGSFMEDKLFPAIFDRIDEIFPDMNFSYSGNAWKSPLKLDGTPAKNKRRDKSVITRGVPERVLEQGGESIGVIDFYMQRNGLSFQEARKELSRICGLEEEELELRRKTAQENNPEDTKKDDIKTNTMQDKGNPTGTEKVSQEEKFAYFLSTPDLSQLAKEKREGITTRYVFGKKDKKESLVLRSGALTLICGKSSHGKSKFIQNLALQIAEDEYNAQGDGVSLFLTYEEELSDVLFQFANMFVGEKRISQYDTPNTEVIRDFYETGTLNKCPQNKRTEVQTKLSGFNALRESGRLRVFYTDFLSQELCSLIRFLSSQMKIKSVFVDYAQLLYRENNRKDRNQELKDICNDLRTCAIDTGLPIVLSAQLNRQTPNPSEMSEDNIADSADLTRYANTIVLLWNASFENITGDKESYLKSQDYQRINGRGFTLGEDGKIYARITKNRGGTPYIETILDFEGETGIISPNDSGNDKQSSTLWGK